LIDAWKSRLQIHFAPDGFVAEVGVQGMPKLICVDKENPLIINRLFQPVQTAFEAD